MDKKNQTSNQNDSSPRRPYEKPGVVSENAFETMALSCASGPECQFLGPDQKS